MDRRAQRRPPVYEPLSDLEGNIDRPVEADPWPTPGKSLRVREGHLEIDGKAEMAAVRMVTAAPPMLENFAQLWEPGRNHDGTVLKFATRWGLLNLCRHQLPMSHEEQMVPLSFALTGDTNFNYTPSGDCQSVFGKEPIATWLYWSRQAAALLGMATRLRAEQEIRPEDWSMLAEEPPWVASSSDPQLLRDTAVWLTGSLGTNYSGTASRFEQSIVSGAIETWLRLARATLVLRWPKNVPEMGWRAEGLFGALGLQLLLATVGVSGFAFCHGCGHVWSRPRSKGRPRLYCDHCVDDEIPQRLADERRAMKS